MSGKPAILPNLLIKEHPALYHEGVLRTTAQKDLMCLLLATTSNKLLHLVEFVCVRELRYCNRCQQFEQRE